MTSPPPLKSWRNFSATEWRHVRDGAIGLVLGSVLPVVVFYVGLQRLGFSAAVVLVLTWSAVVFVGHFRRTGSADIFSATTFAFACVKAAAGLASQNQTLYLAWPSLENMIYGTVFFGSALLGHPILALYAERIYPIPESVRSSRTFRRAFLIVSAGWLVGHVCRALVRLWLLSHLPLEIYLIADTVAGWPINVSLVALTTWFPLRQLQRAGFMTAARPVPAIEAAELALEGSEPTTV